MLEHHVSAKITRKKPYAGLAANHVDGFSDWLHARLHVDGPSVMSFELDRLCRQYVERKLKTGIRTAAITSVFRDSRISGQNDVAA
jgi:hypothetical protein